MRNKIDKLLRTDPIGDFFRNEPFRDLGKSGEAIDDFWKKMTGQESYYDRQAREENERYWEDYTKNTGAESLYPIRTGEVWNAPIQGIPGMGITSGRRAINMLYGGQH